MLHVGITLALAPVFFGAAIAIAATAGCALAPLAVDVDPGVFYAGIRDNTTIDDLAFGLGIAGACAFMAVVASTVFGMRARSRGIDPESAGRNTMIAAGVGVFILHAVVRSIYSGDRFEDRASQTGRRSERAASRARPCRRWRKSRGAAAAPV